MSHLSRYIFVATLYGVLAIHVSLNSPIAKMYSNELFVPHIIDSIELLKSRKYCLMTYIS